jgi:uncharacterized OsmC-like protein
MRMNVSINDHRFKRRPVRPSQRFSAEKLSLLKITLSNLRNKSMTQTSISTITPINRDELVRLSEKAKANPGAVRTLKVKTVLESKFRHLNYIRNLAPHVIDEPPGLLGDDTAPNPSEAVLAALGSCLSVGIHANAVYRNVRLTKVELELEGDINITAVWGTGDTSDDKIVGFSAVRAKVHLEGDASRAELNAIIRHADRWSPVANTLRLPVNVSVEPA